MKALVLGKLTAAPIGDSHDEPFHTITAVHNEPIAGFIRQARLGPAGLQLQCYGADAPGKKSRLRIIAIPLDELFLLAERMDPGFLPAQMVAPGKAAPVAPKPRAPKSALRNPR